MDLQVLERLYLQKLLPMNPKLTSLPQKEATCFPSGTESPKRGLLKFSHGQDRLLHRLSSWMNLTRLHLFVELL